MHSVVETQEFVRQSKKLRMTDEEIDFIKTFVGLNPSALMLSRVQAASAKSGSRFEGAGKVVDSELSPFQSNRTTLKIQVIRVLKGL